MGFKLAERAMANTAITGPTKAVLIVVALKADDKTGKLFPSQETIAEAVGLSVASVRRALGWLEDRSIISRERRRPQTGYRTTDLIVLDGVKLDSYRADSYQAESKVAESKQADSNELPLTQQRATVLTERHNKDDHSVDHSEGHSDLTLVAPMPPSRTFAEFWMVWPRKVSKPQAEKAWTKATMRASPDTIYAAAVAYANNPHIPDKQFIPHAATWLNGDRWNDELPGPRTDHRLTSGERSLAYLRQLAAQQAAETRGLPS